MFPVVTVILVAVVAGLLAKKHYSFAAVFSIGWVVALASYLVTTPAALNPWTIGTAVLGVALLGSLWIVGGPRSANVTM